MYINTLLFMYVNGVKKVVNVYVHREINVVFCNCFNTQIGQPVWDQFWLPTCWYHNFVNNGPILTILVPIKSHKPWLSIGTKMVKIGPLLTKLWPCKLNHHFVKQFSPHRPEYVQGVTSSSCICAAMFDKRCSPFVTSC